MWVPLELQWGHQEISPVASGKLTLLLSCRGRGNITFRSLQGKWASSCIEGEISFFYFFRDAAGSLGFPYSSDGDLRDPLILPQESQVYFHFVRVCACLLSSYCSGIWHHFTLLRNLVMFLEKRRGAFGSS